VLLGEVTANSVHLGDLRFPLTTVAAHEQDSRRVQVLFRPEDVTLAPSPEMLPEHVLGKATVEQTTFIGSFERLRLRLPALPRVQAIAPVVPFGSDAVLIDAARSQDMARRFPLRAGDSTWIGVQRIHALTHPGLRMLLLAGKNAVDQAALALGGHIAQLAHARTTVLGVGSLSDDHTQRLQTVKEQLGSGLAALDVVASADPPSLAIAREVERQSYDLVVLGAQPQGSIDITEQQLHVGEHHLLLVPGPTATPSRFLICVTSGEPGKDDVLFAGRLARHLGAETTCCRLFRSTAIPARRTVFGCR
jgi:sulfate transport system ATP-binding protein